MNYLEYFEDGNKIPEKYTSKLKGLDGEETGQYIIKSSDARFFSDIIEAINKFKQQLNYGRKLKEIAPKNNKTNSSSLAPSIPTTIQLVYSGQKYPGFSSNQWSLSNFSANNF